MKKRIEIYWGGFNSVVATMEAIREILHNDINFNRIVLLQGKDYPLRSNSYIHNFFDERKDQEFCKAKDISTSKFPSDYMKCCGYWCKDRKKNIITQFLTFLNVVVNIKYRRATILINDESWHIYHGWAQFAITDECASYVLSVYDTNSRYNRYMKHCFPPDELYIQTIIHNSCFSKKLSEYTIVPRKNAKWTSPYLNLTYFEYPTVIHIFGSETKYDDLLYTGALFFRKVKIPESNLLIAEIDYNRSKENR